MQDVWCDRNQHRPGVRGGVAGTGRLERADDGGEALLARVHMGKRAHLRFFRGFGCLRQKHTPCGWRGAGRGASQRESVSARPFSPERGQPVHAPPRPWPPAARGRSRRPAGNGGCPTFGSLGALAAFASCKERMKETVEKSACRCNDDRHSVASRLPTNLAHGRGSYAQLRTQRNTFFPFAASVLGAVNIARRRQTSTTFMAADAIFGKIPAGRRETCLPGW